MSDAVASFGAQLHRAGALISENTSFSVEMTAEELNVTSLDSSQQFKEVIHGERSISITADGNFLEDDAAMQGVIDDWLSGDSATYTATWPDGSIDTFTAKVMSVSKSADKGSPMLRSITLACTGAPTLA